MTTDSVALLLTDSSTSQTTLAAGNSQPQCILSTADIANIGQQVLIQQVLRQNTLVVGCNSLLVTSAGALNALPEQTVNSVAAHTGVPAIVKAEDNSKSEVTDSQWFFYGRPA